MSTLTVEPTVGLDRFAPLGLEELDSSAALQTRVDRKYLVPLDRLEEVLAAMDEGTRVLEIDGERSFAYASVYFDTPGLSSYLGAVHRRRDRFKVRTRSYLDTGSCWVEVKTRGPRGATVKTRQEHTGEQADALPTQAWQFASGALGGNRVADLDGPLAPTLVSTYRRTTLHVPGQHGGPASRTTIDTGLVWTDPLTGAEHPLGDLAIVETKTGSAASPTDRLLWRHGIRPVRISKYGTGMAVLHPGLPAHPWRRVLDRHVLPRSA